MNGYFITYYKLERSNRLVPETDTSEDHSIFPFEKVMDSVSVKHILNYLCFRASEMQVLGPLAKWALTNKSKGPSTQTKSF